MVRIMFFILSKRHSCFSVEYLVFVVCCGYLFLFDKVTNGFLKDQPCIHSQDGATGICRPLSECPYTRGDETHKPMRAVDICYSDGAMPIICCVPKVAPSSEKDAIALSQPSAQNDLSGKLSISQRKCKEYADLVYENHISNENVEINKESHCMLQAVPTSGRARLGEFPHMVHLTVTPNTVNDGSITYGGGVLISERYVLTAASYSRAYEFHRVTIYALLGDLVRNDDSDGAEPETIKVIQAIPHPDFEPPKKYFDIALLMLKKEPQLGWRIRPACLSTGNYTDQEFLGIGWGKPYHASKRFSDALRKVALVEAPYDECNHLFDNLEIGIHASSQICAGHPFLISRLCVGDGGGPLHIPSPNHYCMYEIVAINSFGVSGCRISPEVYSRVSYFVSWIESIVWPT